MMHIQVTLLFASKPLRSRLPQHADIMMGSGLSALYVPFGRVDCCCASPTHSTQDTYLRLDQRHKVWYVCCYVIETRLKFVSRKGDFTNCMVT